MFVKIGRMEKKQIQLKLSNIYSLKYYIGQCRGMIVQDGNGTGTRDDEDLNQGRGSENEESMEVRNIESTGVGD